MFWCRNSVVSQFGLNKAHVFYSILICSILFYSIPSKVLQENNPGASTYSKRAVEAELQSTGNNRQARPIGQNPLGIWGSRGCRSPGPDAAMVSGKKPKQNKMTGVTRTSVGRELSNVDVQLPQDAVRSIRVKKNHFFSPELFFNL